MTESQSCCGPECCTGGESNVAPTTEHDVVEAVRSKYGSVATSGLSNDHAGVRAVAEAFGYSADELSSIPADANMGLSCGNPTAFASIKPGEVVVDLGCGGGMDVFLAAPKVGPTGKVIGIDMTPEMIERAQRSAAKSGITNVEFHLASIDRMPLPDSSVDVVISNCVINLAPDKRAVFKEIARVLKPGGRVAVSDIALKKPLPDEVSRDIAAYVGCIAGAIPIAEYEAGLLEAGFQHVQVIDSGADLNAYTKVENQSGCCSPPVQSKTLPLAQSSCCGGSSGASGSGTSAATEPDLHAQFGELLTRYDVNEYAASVKVYAVK
jgi:SAM-dependent methyltransferase